MTVSPAPAAPARVEPTQKHEICEECGDSKIVIKRVPCRCTAQPANTIAESQIDREYMMDDRNFPAANTDDRTADTIPERVPERWKWLYANPKGSDVLELHTQQVMRELGTAETRIEVLEAALRLARKDVEYKRDYSQTAIGRKNAARTIDAIDSALAPPPGQKEKVL